MSRPTTTAGQYSPAVEDYLRAILALAGEDGATTVRALAERLAVRRPSISQMTRRLAGLGLVVHDRYGDISLTDAGQSRAAELQRRYALVERYLVEALGYDPATVAGDADRIEHALSVELVARLRVRLDNDQPSAS